jgi:DNA-binding NarL/FixJ family response regulator
LEPVKVLIADDHPLIREGLIKVIELDPGIRVIGEAGDGEDVITKAMELQPDVIIMDIHMPRKDGLEATGIIKREYPGIKVVALTVEDSEQKVIEVIRAGVSGYILKDIEPEALSSTIRAVHAGEMVIHPKITSMLFKELAQATGQRLDEVGLDNSVEVGSSLEQFELTPRETEILRYIAQGIHNREMAAMLYISEKTVKNHISSIFRKLQVKDRTQAALSAIKFKLVNL